MNLQPWFGKETSKHNVLSGTNYQDIWCHKIKMFRVNIWCRTLGISSKYTSLTFLRDYYSDVVSLVTSVIKWFWRVMFEGWAMDWSVLGVICYRRHENSMSCIIYGSSPEVNLMRSCQNEIQMKFTNHANITDFDHK
jgi:hypothetical protein